MPTLRPRPVPRPRRQRATLLSAFGFVQMLVEMKLHDPVANGGQMREKALSHTKERRVATIITVRERKKERKKKYISRGNLADSLFLLDRQCFYNS